MAITVQQLFRQLGQQDLAPVKRAFSLNPSLVHSKHPRDAHTPLHAAAALGNLQLVKELLQLGELGTAVTDCTAVQQVSTLHCKPRP